MGCQLLFWGSAFLIVYVYLGYPALQWALSWFKGKPPVRVTDGYEPTVSLIIPAYNEEQTIGQKLENSLALDYPRDKLEVIVVSDGSTDQTAEVVRAYMIRGIQLVDLCKNVGKASAQNEAVRQANGDILLFTDAEVFFQPDVVRRLTRHFHDENVGCVVGKVVYLNEEDTAVSEGEGSYWRYELFLRQKESELGNLVMGSGSIMAVRRGLFDPLDPAVSEDFVLPMGAAIQGYRTVYEPHAIARLKLYQVRPYDMLKTKVRTITLDTRSLFLCRAVLNPFRYPAYAWGLISHKLLRWLVPYFLIALFVTNILLVNYPFYLLTLALQIAFYILGLTGYVVQRKGKPPRTLGISFSFCVVNLAALIGVVRFVMGKRARRWVPVR